MSASDPGVYAAEREVFGKKFRGLEVGVALSDATEIINRYTTGWTVKRTASSFDGGSWCYLKAQRISLARDAGLPIVLHELAHALAETHGHGLAFQRAYLDLVAKEISPHMATRLRNAFIRHKCKGYKTLRADG